MTSFVYDARDKFTSETSVRAGSYSAALVYDGVTMNTTTGPGNPTTERGVGFTYDTKGDNQIASDRNGHAWAYDGDGNPVTYQSYANAFDPENRMTAYGLPTGGGHARLTMGYDDTGMRAWKEPTNLARVYFLYDGSDIIAELNSTGALSTYQTVGPDGVISRRSGSTSSFYAFDPAGNPSAVLSSTGGVLGDEVFEANGRRDSAYSSRPVDFGGQWGYYGDAETSLTLLGHRYYDAYAGRFLTRDPIGYDGGVNLYSYTANNYENEIDPNGYDPFNSSQIQQVNAALKFIGKSPLPQDALIYHYLEARLADGRLSVDSPAEAAKEELGEDAYVELYPWDVPGSAPIHLLPTAFDTGYATETKSGKAEANVKLAATLYHECQHADVQGTFWIYCNGGGYPDFGGGGAKEGWARKNTITWMEMMYTLPSTTQYEESGLEYYINYWYNH